MPNPSPNPEPQALDALQQRIGYRFRQPELLQLALTHGSHRRRMKGAPCDDYQRLEFLGDAVLGLVVSELLYRTFPEEREGELARRKAQLIAGPTLVRIAGRLRLQEAMRVSLHAADSDRAEAALVEDACEALIGAMYLDGGFEAVKSWVTTQWQPEAAADHEAPKDPKTGLQEWTQARGLGLPDYRELGREGPPHAPIFTIEVTVPGHGGSQASAHSKRAASVEAAAALLAQLEKGTKT